MEVAGPEHVHSVGAAELLELVEIAGEEAVVESDPFSS